MKGMILLLSLWACCFVRVGKAQSLVPAPVFPKISNSAAKPTAKITTVDLRLCAVSSYGYRKSIGYYFVDSNALSWSGTMVPDYEAAPLPVYSYDHAQENIYAIAASSSILVKTKTLNTYNTALQVTASIVLSWNTATLSWDSSSRTTHTYSTYGIVTSLEEENLAGTWVGRSKTSYSYSSGLLVAISVKLSTGASTAWVNSRNTLLDYSTSMLSTRTEQAWDAGSMAWVNESRIQYGYTVTDTTQKISQTWNSASYSWDNETRTQYDFTERPYADEYIDRWNRSTGSWDHYEKHDAIYAAGDLAYFLEQSWNSTTGSWDNTDRHFYSFTGLNLTVYGNQYWDGTKWNTNIIRDYKYNTDDQLIRSNYYVWDGVEFVDIEADNTRCNYYYEEPASLVQAASAFKALQVYPNPAGAVQAYLSYKAISADPAGVLLTDISGRVLWQGQEPGFIGDHMLRIPLDQLSPGIYLLRLGSAQNPAQTLKIHRL